MTKPPAAWFVGLSSALIAAVGLLAAARAVDPVFQGFGLLLFGFGALMIFRVVAHGFAPPTPGRYDDRAIKLFTGISVFWGVAAFLAGLYLALELAFPALNFGLEYINFGRLRPLLTSAGIFAFGGHV